jgi:hypothetical protein
MTGCVSYNAYDFILFSFKTMRFLFPASVALPPNLFFFFLHRKQKLCCGVLREEKYNNIL